jgi:hypothetical protein
VSAPAGAAAIPSPLRAPQTDVTHAGADDGFRAGVLRAHGAGDGEVAELLEYGRNRFDAGAVPAHLPLADEPFVAAWDGYVREAGEGGAFRRLREVLVQLAFPVAEGISGSDAYLAATRRGELPPGGAVDGGLALERPDELRLFVHSTAAGRIPVLVTACRADFVSLVRALTLRNEPAPVPDSMGACIVGGYNNWDRVRQLRARWEASHGEGDVEGWTAEWRTVVPRKELYQDRFVLLSDGPYSAVPAGEMGMGEGEWLRRSLAIRLEHECCHYFTRRAFGSMRNSLHDEILADYAGIRAAAGAYRADWFLRFMGVEDPRAFRPGGRMQHYRGTPPLSDGAFAVLRALVAIAAENLEALDASGLTGGDTPAERARTLVALASLTVEALAHESAADAFLAALPVTADAAGKE